VGSSGGAHAALKPFGYLCGQVADEMPNLDERDSALVSQISNETLFDFEYPADVIGCEKFGNNRDLAR
jgi:hypothetical protein